MVDVERVCCMCGDVGFSDKIFRCINCQNRFQHLYCSNYYNQLSGLPKQCDWCQSDEIKRSKHGKRPAEGSSRHEYSNDKIKKHDRGDERSEKAVKSPSGAPSPRTSTRRYKLLKDVMC